MAIIANVPIEINQIIEEPYEFTYYCPENLYIGFPFYGKTVKHFELWVSTNRMFIFRSHWLINDIIFDKESKRLKISFKNKHAYELVWMILVMIIALILTNNLYNGFFYKLYIRNVTILYLIDIFFTIISNVLPIYQFFTISLIYSLLLYTNLFKKHFIISKGTPLFTLVNPNNEPFIKDIKLI